MWPRPNDVRPTSLCKGRSILRPNVEALPTNACIWSHGGGRDPDKLVRERKTQ